MPDKTIHIGDRVISEKTVIKTNIKTLLWVCIGLFSILTFLFTFFYLDLKKRNEELYQNIENTKQEINSSLNKEIKTLEERHFEIRDNIGDLRGDIKVILDRTSNRQVAQPRTINESNTPSNTPVSSSNLPR